MKRPPLGRLSAERFLRRHWQKKPLLVRAALSEFEAAFSVPELFALACRDDVESRLVTRGARRWSVTHGPFRRRELESLPTRNWSLLVQGVENFLPAGRALMARFDFIPYARQDDLMVSLAPPGGGVGPHFDSYDVFLLQVRGRRRWRIGAQTDLSLVEGTPLKLLARFRPEQELVVEPGDLLYLPPRYAHDGVAESDCVTCSIGFRAPGTQELATSFLQWLQDDLTLDGRYCDPRLQAQRHPAQVSSAMLSQVERMLAAMRWRRATVERFLGEHLTEPKPQVWFERPRRALAFAAFTARARRDGVRLALKTRMLYRGRHVFINGEAIAVPGPARPALRAFADRREAIPWASDSVWAARRLHAWYRCGYVELA